MKAWLKGGIILSILDLILLGLILFPQIADRYAEGPALVWYLLHLPLSFLYMNLFSISSSNFGIFILFIVGILNWFIIGSILGYIVGFISKKVKKK